MAKKICVFIFASLIALTFLAGCDDKYNTQNDGKIKIVSTIFPQYDWVREILGDKGDNAELILLLDRGIDMHSYQPTVDDIITLSSCDVLIYVGGESDAWIENSLNKAENKNIIAISLLDVLGSAVKEEEILEGMSHHDDDCGDEHEVKNGESGHIHEGEPDEHVWLSLNNAKTLCSYICDQLCVIDKENAGEYKLNLNNYIEKLDKLDGDYKKTVENAGFNTLVFGDRFPFRYLTDDYSIDYYAAFPGCSAETEASFDTIVFLSGKINELNLKSIFVTESSDKSVAKTIIQNTRDKNQEIFVLNSIQSITSSDISAGATYLSIMENNLEVLKETLK